MRFLVLGGGGFLGYHVVAAAVGAGHEVSAFTREGEAPMDGVEPLSGDRYGDLSALRGREWDAVLDTFTDPEAVGKTVRLLSGRAGTYGFVSGITNYHPGGPDVVDEGSPLRGPEETGFEDDPLHERGLAKIRGEHLVAGEFGGGAFVVRVGIMVGPRDPTDRFSWWPERFTRGGEVLAPGDPRRAVQYTDARDLAGWMVRMLGSGQGGTFNGVGPGRDVTLAEVLDACRRAAEEHTGERSPVSGVTWAGEEFLEERLAEVPEEERPLWFPEPQIPFSAVDSSKAVAAGLRFRPVVETARETLGWLGRERPGEGLRAGLSPVFEEELLRGWRETRR